MSHGGLTSKTSVDALYSKVFRYEDVIHILIHGRAWGIRLHRISRWAQLNGPPPAY